MNEKMLRDQLDRALRAERDGFEFYSSAAARSEDPGAKAMFARLAEDERSHYMALQERLRAIADGNGWVSERLQSEAWDPERASELFTPEFVERIGQHHVEMSALSIGILLERRSVEFYREQERQAQNAEVKAFFGDLAAWETAHHDVLLALDDQMKADYWEANRFEPLL